MPTTRPLKLLRNALIGFVVVSGVLLLVVRCAGRVPRVAVGAQVHAITITSQQADGSIVVVEVPRSDADNFDQLEKYLEGLSGRRGSVSFASYIEVLIVQTPTLRVNLLQDVPVISTRDNPEDSFWQRVLTPSDDDASFKAFVEDLLHSEHAVTRFGTP